MRPNNPFSTTFGREPDNLIARLEEQQKIIDIFSSDKPSENTFIITGVRGTGKTVLLSTVYNHFKDEDSWVVVDPGPKNNILENVAASIYEEGKVKRLFAETEFSFSFQGIGFTIKGKTPVSTIYTLLVKMLDYLKKKGRKVLITIDEADNSEQMRYFIQAYQSLLMRDYPIRLLMTGLYENIYKLQEDQSLTFLYRAPKIFLGPLNIGSIAARYRQYLGADTEKSLELAKLTKGYAYAYQVLGYLLYGKGDLEIDEMLLADYDQYLSDYVYEKIYAGLSDSEKKILGSFKDGSPLKTSEICKRTGYSQKYIGVYRDRLCKGGILSSPSYGYLQLSLPRFENFLSYKVD